LERLRAAQLDGEVHTKEEAVALAERLLQTDDFKSQIQNPKSQTNLKSQI
jgi:hypothetical protein